MCVCVERACKINNNFHSNPFVHFSHLNCTGQQKTSWILLLLPYKNCSSTLYASLYDSFDILTLILYFCAYNKQRIQICVFWWKVIAIKFFHWREILSSLYWCLPAHIQISCNHSKDLLLFWLNIIHFPPIPKIKLFTTLEYWFSKQKRDNIICNNYSIRDLCLLFQTSKTV